jgi:pimeloyl-ACP methyl ester carboxylesterase
VGRDLSHVDGVHHHYVDANGVSLHVAEAGEGEPVVMVHGWPQHWWEWRRLIPTLSRTYRVICPDLRGFGWSDTPGEGYDPETFAVDTLALLDALGIDRVRLVGHDWGGLAGYIICLRHPQRVSRYMALNVNHPWPRVRLGALLRDGWRLWYQAALAASALSPRGLTPSIQSIKRRIRGSTRHPECWDNGVLEAFTDQLREPARSDATAKLYREALTRLVPAIARGRYMDMRLTVPTLHLHGADDVAIRPDVLDGYEEHADDMRLEVIPDTGHYIVDERPELVLDRALSFLAQP